VAEFWHPTGALTGKQVPLGLVVLLVRCHARRGAPTGGRRTDLELRASSPRHATSCRKMR
jgi:hypothetical protein